MLPFPFLFLCCKFEINLKDFCSSDLARIFAASFPCSSFVLRKIKISNDWTAILLMSFGFFFHQTILKLEWLGKKFVSSQRCYEAIRLSDFSFEVLVIAYGKWGDAIRLLFVFPFEVCVRLNFLCCIPLLPLWPFFKTLKTTNTLRLNPQALVVEAFSSY